MASSAERSAQRLLHPSTVHEMVHRSATDRNRDAHKTYSFWQQFESDAGLDLVHSFSLLLERLPELGNPALLADLST